MNDWAANALIWLWASNLALGAVALAGCATLAAIALVLRRKRPEWPLFSADVPRGGDGRTLAVPGLGLTMTDGGERIAAPGASPDRPPRSLSIRMPSAPVAAGAAPNLTWTVRSGDSVYYVAVAELPVPVRGLAPARALEVLGRSALSALAESGSCRVLGTRASLRQDLPCLTLVAESHPEGQPPYRLATSLIHAGDVSVTVGYGARAADFHKIRFARLAASLRLEDRQVL
jgi:hypothetical protein